MGMTKAPVSRLVERLVQKELVNRQHSRHDGRAQQIWLSYAGQKLVPELAAIADENDEALFGHLPMKVRPVMIALMQDIAKRYHLSTIVCRVKPMTRESPQPGDTTTAVTSRWVQIWAIAKQHFAPLSRRCESSAPSKQFLPFTKPRPSASSSSRISERCGRVANRVGSRRIDGGAVAD